MQFYISKYTHSCVSNTFTLRLCIKISGIIQLLKFSMLCAMYLFIPDIQVIHIRLKNLLDIEIDTLKQNPYTIRHFTLSLNEVKDVYPTRHFISSL